MTTEDQIDDLLDKIPLERWLRLTPTEEAKLLATFLGPRSTGRRLRSGRNNKSAIALEPLTEAELDDLRFAFRVAKHVKSNTIIYAKDKATVGIGAGQMSRVDSARIAARKAEDAAKTAGLDTPLTKGSVVASDAFFPFADNIEEIAQAGIKAIIQPGGSVRDQDSIDAANKHGIAMVFTGVRHFRH